MSDLSKRLRAGKSKLSDHLTWMVTDIHIEAADALEAQEAMIKELEMALVGWVNAAEMLADEPGMDAHFQDIADATLDTVEGARNDLSKAPSIK